MVLMDGLVEKDFSIPVTAKLVSMGATVGSSLMEGMASFG